MSELLGSFQLPSPERGERVGVELYQDVENQQIQFIENQWMPILKERQDRAILEVKAKSIADADERMSAYNNALASAGAPDGHWNWRNKMNSAGSEGACAAFFVGFENSVEAIMECRLLHFAREASQVSQPSIYVNHVAVAPWNRHQIQNPRHIAKLGDLMMATAVSLSLEEGFGGRVGLHSLAQAEGFYQRCGMSDLGPDEQYSRLRYFEFTDAQAAAFIA